MVSPGDGLKLREVGPFQEFRLQGWKFSHDSPLMSSVFLLSYISSIVEVWKQLRLSILYPPLHTRDV